jgi:hypothetical protein
MARPVFDLAARAISRSLCTLCLSALALVPALAPAAAQTPAAQTGPFGLELNNLEDVDGACRLTFLANNATGVALSQTSYEVVVFDETGAVSQRLILEFGQLPENKTKVVQFLLDRGCDRISRLLLNDVVECVATEGGAVPHCLDALAPSSRVDVQFGA